MMFVGNCKYLILWNLFEFYIRYLLIYDIINILEVCNVCDFIFNFGIEKIINLRFIDI